jgi:hypothetical protein
MRWVYRGVFRRIDITHIGWSFMITRVVGCGFVLILVLLLTLIFLPYIVKDMEAHKAQYDEAHITYTTLQSRFPYSKDCLNRVLCYALGGVSLSCVHMTPDHTQRYCDYP